MLVLQRGVDEAVIISHPDGDIRVVVVMVKGRAVRLGFEAPRSIKIVREDAKEKGDDVPEAPF